MTESRQDRRDGPDPGGSSPGLRPIAPSHARSDREDYAAFLARKTPLDMPTGREVLIYTLTDPFSLEVRYIRQHTGPARSVVSPFLRGRQ